MKKINIIAPILGTIAASTAGIAAVGCSCKPSTQEIKITYKVDSEKGTWASWCDGNPATLPLGTTSFKVKLKVDVLAEGAMVRAEQTIGGGTVSIWTPSTTGEQEVEFTITGNVTSFDLLISGE